MTREDFVTFEQAQRLKELGFDWGCTHGYDTKTGAFFASQEYPISGQTPMTIDDILYDYNTNYTPPQYVCISAPTLAQAAKWLREHKGIFIGIWNNACGYGWDICDTHGTGIAKFDDNGDDLDSGMFTTYELALSAGIDKALEILTNNK